MASNEMCDGQEGRGSGGARRKTTRSHRHLDRSPAIAADQVNQTHAERIVQNRPIEAKLSFSGGFSSSSRRPANSYLPGYEAAASASGTDTHLDSVTDDKDDPLASAEAVAVDRDFGQGEDAELCEARNAHCHVQNVYAKGEDDEDRSVFLDHRSKEEVALLVSALTNGATPLLMACRNGHMDVVEYLFKRCDADIEQAGSVTFDGETIEGAPPLWVAAAAGHLNIVRFLILRGASVNCTTKTNSTPLRAACFDGHFEIVQYLIEHGADMEVANRHGHTCLMIACYKGHLKIARYLIELNVDVNRKSVKGNTALHDCAESGSLEILQLLLANGAKMDVDSYGMTPLLAAAVTGHTHIVEYIVNHLDSVHRKEKIDALELLGATYVDRKRDMLGALEYWNQALLLRHGPGLVALPKPQGQSPIAAFENTVEAATREQLEDAVSDPDEMRMQALLVRERILGPAHPETSYYIRYRGAVYADTGNFSRCIRLWMYALEMQQSMLEPLSPMTNSSLLSFAELFSFMMAERDTESRRPASQRLADPHQVVGLMAPQRSPPNIPPLSFVDVMAVLNRAVREVRNGTQQLAKLPLGERDLTYLHRTLGIIVHLIFLLAKLQPQLSTAQDFALKKCLYDLVRLNTRSRNGYTLLHLACTRDNTTLSRYPISNFPSTDVIRLLLDVGADPNATDQDGSTALHILAQGQSCPSSAVQVILQRGGHLDQVNLQGLSFADLLKSQPIHQVINSLQFTTLKCLCARVVRQQRMRFKGLVPLTLEPFIQKH